MTIGVCIFEIHFPESNSLKKKRYHLKGLKTKIRNKYNVSLAEIDHFDLWQKAKLAAVCVSPESKFANEVLNNMINFIKFNVEGELIDYKIEMM
ncbi:MAG: DUF503 domain-containing protein [Candidatus Delongbacteria bacterium]|nr:DUF503 domain-containing protein [Candidatus Delongbacteria bacterium]